MAASLLSAPSGLFVALLVANTLVAVWLAWDFVRARRDVKRYFYPAGALILLIAERLAVRLSAPNWVSAILFLAFFAVIVWYVFRIHQEDETQE